VTALSVWTFPSTGDAGRIERRLSEGAAGDVVVIDGALAAWGPGRTAPRIRELQGAARSASLGVGFWGLLFGIVVAGPELADLDGGPRSSLDGSLAGVGIDPDLLADLRRGLLPGRSALAVLADESVTDDIQAAIDGTRHEHAQRCLTSGQEAALRRVFST
jgi:uncharacterized membrane protein